MITTLEQLKEECLKYKFVVFPFVAHESDDNKNLEISTGLIVEIIEKIQSTTQSEIEIDQEKIGELIGSSTQPIWGSIPSVEEIIEKAEKQKKESK